MGIDGKSDNLITRHIKVDELLLFFLPVWIGGRSGTFQPPFSRCHAVQVWEVFAKRQGTLSVKARGTESGNEGDQSDQSDEIFHWHEH